MKIEIENALAEIGKMLELDDGGIELVGITLDGVATVRLTGGCVGCPGAQMTLATIVEKKLKEADPEIKKVVLA